jgi:hypothetical protein
LVIPTRGATFFRADEKSDSYAVRALTIAKKTKQRRRPLSNGEHAIETRFDPEGRNFSLAEKNQHDEGLQPLKRCGLSSRHDRTRRDKQCKNVIRSQQAKTPKALSALIWVHRCR